MKNSKLCRHLTQIHQEMMKDMSERLAVPSGFTFMGVVCRHLLSNGSLVVNRPKKEYKIYVCAESIEKELTEKEIAEAELGLVHESAHVLHMNANPVLDRQYTTEKEIAETLESGLSTPTFQRLFDLSETVAEYFALYYLDGRQGLDNFLKRLEDKDKSGLYGRVLKVMKKLDRERMGEIAELLIRADYKKAREIPELEEGIFSFTEKYIERNPRVYSQPQLALPGLRYIC